MLKYFMRCWRKWFLEFVEALVSCVEPKQTRLLGGQVSMEHS